jgi:hypothetical protein
METIESLKARRDEILCIAARHGAMNVRVFGSFARGNAGADSDIDLLVAVGEKTSSWFPAGMVLDLEALLGRRVEVVTERGLHPLLREQVFEEATPI